MCRVDFYLLSACSQSGGGLFYPLVLVCFVCLLLLLLAFAVQLSLRMCHVIQAATLS